MPRDIEAENYAAAQSYDLADRAADQPDLPDEADYRYQTKAEGLESTIKLLTEDLRASRRIQQQGLYVWHQEMAARHIADVEARLTTLKAELDRALAAEQAAAAGGAR